MMQSVSRVALCTSCKDRSTCKHQDADHTLTSELMSSDTTPNTTANVNVPNRNMPFSSRPATRLLSCKRLTPANVPALVAAALYTAYSETQDSSCWPITRHNLHGRFCDYCTNMTTTAPSSDAVGKTRMLKHYRRPMQLVYRRKRGQIITQWNVMQTHA